MWKLNLLRRRKPRKQTKNTVQEALFATGPREHDRTAANMVVHHLRKFNVEPVDNAGLPVDFAARGEQKSLRVQFGLLDLKLYNARGRHPWVSTSNDRGSLVGSSSSSVCDALIYVTYWDDSSLDANDGSGNLVDDEAMSHFLSVCREVPSKKLILILAPLTLLRSMPPVNPRNLSEDTSAFTLILNQYKAAARASREQRHYRTSFHSHVLEKSASAIKFISFLSGAMEQATTSEKLDPYGQTVTWDNTSVTYSYDEADNLGPVVPSTE